MSAEAATTFAEQREALVQGELRALGIRDRAVLDAMKAVPREAFVPAELAEFAYRNVPLPIESGQTISQPYIVALMTEALKLEPGDRVLEIGAGSGYAAAVLSKLANEVFTIERHAGLAETARRRLEEQGCDNVHVLHGDGTRGWPEMAPFDAIVATASGPGVPRALLEQLKDGGRLVIPVGKSSSHQVLLRITRRREGDYDYEELAGVRFVPLLGDGEWTDASELAKARAHWVD